MRHVLSNCIHKTVIMCPLVHLCGRNGQNMFQALSSFWVSESKCFSLVVWFFGFFSLFFCFFSIL